MKTYTIIQDKDEVTKEFENEYELMHFIINHFIVDLPITILTIPEVKL